MPEMIGRDHGKGIQYTGRRQAKPNHPNFETTMQCFRKPMPMADKRLLHFQFDRIQTAGTKKWLVSVFDDGQRLCFFEMRRIYNHWYIVNAPKVPERFLQMERMLDQLIKDYDR